MVSIDDECEFHGLFKERIPGPLRWPSLATNLASCPTESESSGASIHYRRSAYILVLRTRTIGGSSTIDSLPATVDHASQSGSRLGRSALLDFAHREIIPRNVKSPLVHLHILHLKTCCQNWWNNWFHLPAGRCSDSHSRRHIGLSEVDLVTKDIVSPPPRFTRFQWIITFPRQCWILVISHSQNKEHYFRFERRTGTDLVCIAPEIYW